MVVGTRPRLAAVGSATVAVLSQSSSLYRATIFFAMRRGHVLTIIIAPFTVHVQTTATTVVSIIHARSVF